MLKTSSVYLSLFIVAIGLGQLSFAVHATGPQGTSHKNMDLPTKERTRRNIKEVTRNVTPAEQCKSLVLKRERIILSMLEKLTKIFEDRNELGRMSKHHAEIVTKERQKRADWDSTNSEQDYEGIASRYLGINSEKNFADVAQLQTNLFLSLLYANEIWRAHHEFVHPDKGKRGLIPNKEPLHSAILGNVAAKSVIDLWHRGMITHYTHLKFYRVNQTRSLWSYQEMQPVDMPNHSNHKMAYISRDDFEKYNMAYALDLDRNTGLTREYLSKVQYDFYYYSPNKQAILGSGFNSRNIDGDMLWGAVYGVIPQTSDGTFPAFKESWNNGCKKIELSGRGEQAIKLRKELVLEHPIDLSPELARAKSRPNGYHKLTADEFDIQMPFCNMAGAFHRLSLSVKNKAPY